MLIKYKKASRRSLENYAKSNDQFVDREQKKIASKMSNDPKIDPRMMRTDAFMSNNGETSYMASNKLTATIDPEFPVK